MPGSGEIAGRARIFFDLDAAYWQGTLLSPTVEGEVWMRDQTAGVFGFRRIPGAVGAAYAMNEWVSVGGRLDWAVEPDRGGTVTLRGGLNPFVQVFFGRDRNVRPFALLRGGVGRSHTFNASADEGFRAIGPRTWYPTLGGGLGAHVFITEAVSFDAVASLDYRWNFSRPLLSAADSGGEARAASWRYQDATVSTALTFGFSHWF